MDDKNFKELDHFFKKRLAQKDIVSNGWDVPNDSVLDSVLNTVNTPKENKKRRPIWLWLSLSGLILITFAYFLLDSTNEIDKLNQQITELSISNENHINSRELASDNSILPIVEKASEDFSTIVTQNSSEYQNSSEVKFASVVNPKTTNQKVRNFSVSKKPASSISKKTDLYNNNISNQDGLFSSNMVVYKPLVKNIPIIEKSSEVFRSISLLEYLPFLEFINLTVNSHPSLTMNDPVIDKKEENSIAKISGFMTLGHLYSSLQMTNLPEVDYSLTDYDQFYSGWNLGTGIEYQLSEKVQIGASLNYSVIKNESNFKEDIAYLKSNETTSTGGDVFYNMSLDIVSPTGSHSENLSMNVTNLDFQDGEILSSRAHIWQDFKTISLTGYGNYRIFQLNDITLDLQGGLGLNYLASTNQKMELDMMHEQDMMMSKTIITENKYDLEDFYINGQLGLRIQKPISENWFLGISSGINRSFTPIRKNNSSNESKTYIGGFQSSINLGYRF